MCANRKAVRDFRQIMKGISSPLNRGCNNIEIGRPWRNWKAQKLFQLIKSLIVHTSNMCL